VVLVLAGGAVAAQSSAVVDLAAARAAELAKSPDARVRYAGLVVADMGRWRDRDGRAHVSPGSLAHPDAATWSALWRASDDPLILAHIARCVPVSETSCEESGEALARLLEVEPNNLSHWLIAIERAREDDDAALAAAFAGAAASTRFDPRDGDFVRLLADAWQPVAAHPSQVGETRSAGLPDSAGGILTAIGVWLAIAMPALQPLADACDPATPPALLRRDQCRHIGGLLHASPETSELLASFGMQIAFAASEDAQAMAALEAEHVLFQWRKLKLHEVAAPSGRPGEDRVANAALVRAWQRAPGEVAAVRAMLSELGTLLIPPADWRPPHTLADRAEEREASRAAKRRAPEPAPM
jgi:hypothetical protein